MKYSCYFYCQLLDEGGNIVSQDTALFVKPKHFSFESPGLSASVLETEEGITISVTAQKYARSVRLSAGTLPVRFSDNYFDIIDANPVNIRMICTTDQSISALELEKSLSICSVYDIR